MNTLQQADFFGFAEYLPTRGTFGTDTYRDVYEQNRDRVYALALWMSGNELAAEELTTNTFCRIFAETDSPTPEEVDRALIVELRQQIPLGGLTLDCMPCDKIFSARKNTLRVDLERAVLQLPNTERIIFLMHDMESYDHGRIARTVHLTEDKSRSGLHQARLRIRELLAT